jgi:hypothetical protein
MTQKSCIGFAFRLCQMGHFLQTYISVKKKYSRNLQSNFRHQKLPTIHREKGHTLFFTTLCKCTLIPQCIDRTAYGFRKMLLNTIPNLAQLEFLYHQD